MKWVTKEEYKFALHKFNNETFYVGRFGTLEEQRAIYEEYMEVLRNYKLTKACKKLLFVAILAILSFIGYKFFTNTNGVEEVQSCSISNTCNYKNQN